MEPLTILRGQMGMWTLFSSAFGMTGLQLYNLPYGSLLAYFMLSFLLLLVRSYA